MNRLQSKRLKGLALTLAGWLLLAAPARAAIGIMPAIASDFPFSSPAPDLMTGVTLFYEPLPWLVLRAGAFGGEGTMHYPLSVGYVLPSPVDFQLRPRLEAGIDPYTDPDGNGTAWHMGVGFDYLPFDNNWVIGLGIQLVFGTIGYPDDQIKGQSPPLVQPWLVRTELGIGYKF
jgi:hypothetical protein